MPVRRSRQHRVSHERLRLLVWASVYAWLLRNSVAPHRRDTKFELVRARPAAARRDQILCDGFVLSPA